MADRIRTSGKVLQDAIVDLAQRLGWAAVHFRNSRTKDGDHLTAVAYDAKGWPDLVLVRDRVVFIEVKGDGDSLSDDQKVWLERLERAGQEVYVATPAKWRNGDFDDVLAR